MAKLLYNIRAYEDTAANWAADDNVYPANSLLIASDTGALKKGDGVNAYADLAYAGVKQVAKIEDIDDWPETFPPEIGVTATTAAAGNHDHAVVADEDSDLEAAATIQALAEALSTRISEHDHAVVEDAESGLVAASTIQDLAEALSTRISAHDHAVVADEDSGLAEASTIQALAIALSTRIKALEDLAST